MGIIVEARIEPNVTRIEPNLARIPRLHPNNDPNVDPNRDEYCRIPPIYPNTPQNRWRYMWSCRSCILAYLAYSHVSALYSDGDSDGFWELFGAFWADSALFVLFGSIWLDDSGRSSTYDTNKPESA